MPKFNLGWLKDKNGEKFAPKTFTTQVLDDTGKKNLKEILENTEEKIEEKIKNKIDSPTTAEVGQELIVKEVDKDGKPTDWEYVERPCYIEEKLLFDKYLDIKDVGIYGDFTYYYSEDEKFTLVVDKEYKVIIDGYVHDETCYDDNGKPCIYVSMNQYVTIYEDYLYGDFNNCSFQIIEINTKQLDESLIPDNMFIKKPMSSGSNGDVLTSDSYGNAYWSNSYAKKTDLNSYAKTTRYATSSQAGLVRTSTSYGTKMNGQYIQTEKATTSDISSKSNQYKPIVPYNLDEAVRYGLGASKLTWTEAEKTKARKVIGAISASDIPEVEPQVQADYEETNSSSVSYIKNKTHYDTRRLVEINEQINYGGYNTYGNITSDLYDLFINKTVDGLLVDGKTISYASEYINNKYGYLIYDLSDNRQLIVNAYSTRAYVMDNSALDNSISGTLTVTGSGNCGSFKQLDEKFIPDNIPKIATATIGQILEVEEVDENSKPTKWKAVNQTSRIEYITHNAIENQVINPEDETQTFTLKSVGYLDNKRRKLYKNSYFQFYLDDEEFLINSEELVDVLVPVKDKVLFQFRELNVLLDTKLDRKTGLVDFVFKFSDILTAPVTVSAYYKQEIYHQLNENLIPSTVPVILSATKGQFLKVKSVDENGKPITWEVSDKPTYTAEEVGALSADTEIPSIEGLATEEYVETKIAELEPGFSPIATVEQTDEGVNITIEDKNGTTTASVYHGKDGKTPYVDEEGFIVYGSGAENLPSGECEVSKEEFDALSEDVSQLSEDKADKADTYTKAEVDEKIQNMPSGEGASLDVQINGTSIVENGVANIPFAGYKDGVVNYEGLVKIPKGYGLDFQYGTNNLIIANADSFGYLKNRNTAWQSEYYAINAKSLDKAVKLAMTDGKGAEWTAEEKASARERIGCEWRYIGKLETDEEVAKLSMDLDENGQPFVLRKVRVLFKNMPNTSDSTNIIRLVLSGQSFNYLPTTTGVKTSENIRSSFWEIELINTIPFAVNYLESYNNGTTLQNKMCNRVSINDSNIIAEITKVELISVGGGVSLIGAGAYMEVWGCE